MTHLDPADLAEYRAGLSTGRRGARIAAHLAECQQCAAFSDELGDELAGVSALLASVPAPALPDPVALRLDAVLAAEVAHRNDAERAGADRAQDRASRRAKPVRRPRARLLSLRVLAPAAAVVLAAGGYGLSQLAGPGHESGTYGNTAANSAGPAARAAAPAANGSTPVTGGVSPGTRRLAPVSFPLVVSQVDFLPGTLRQQVETALRVPTADRTTQTASAAVRACVLAVAGGSSPSLVEKARYQGQAATVIVVQTAAGGTAWVAGAACSASRHDVLDSTTVPAGISGP